MPGIGGLALVAALLFCTVLNARLSGSPILTPTAASAQTPTGRQGPDLAGPVRVVDADTLDLGGARIRLWGVDAPEAAQTCDRDGELWRCGAAAARALGGFIADRPVDCERVGRPDRNGRIVARCAVAGQDLGAWLVTEGWALDYARYSGGRYGTEEAAARSSRRGLWSSRFERPWDWRRARAAN
jgi:endonuclease YncB( thermonuclease family)